MTITLTGTFTIPLTATFLTANFYDSPNRHFNDSPNRAYLDEVSEGPCRNFPLFGGAVLHHTDEERNRAVLSDGFLVEIVLDLQASETSACTNLRIAVLGNSHTLIAFLLLLAPLLCRSKSILHGQSCTLWTVASRPAVQAGNRSRGSLLRYPR
jgi:hypothetical protein